MKIYAAIAGAMADVEAISKNRRNDQQGFRFRGIDDVYNQLHGLLAKHRIFSAPEVLESRHEERKTAKGATLIYRVLTIRYTFYAEDGSSVAVTVIGEGMDSGDKAANKAMAVAHKYALLQLFCVPTEDMPDPDQTAHDPSEPVVQPPKTPTPPAASQADLAAAAAKALSTFDRAVELGYAELDKRAAFAAHISGMSELWQINQMTEAMERKIASLQGAA